METLHSLSFEWGNGAALEIESAKGKAGRQLPTAAHPFAKSALSEALPDETSELGIPAMAWRDGTDALFEPLQLREYTEYLVDITLPMSRTAAAAARGDNATWPLGPRLASLYRSDPPKRWRSDGDKIVVTGTLNLRAHVGVVDLTPPGAEPLRFEVVPKKLGYFDDFRALLDGIAEELTGLLIQVGGATSSRFAVHESARPDPRSLLFHLRALIDGGLLGRAIEAITRRPHSQLSTDHSTRSYDEPFPSDPDYIADRLESSDLVQGGPLAKLFGGYTPQSLPYRESISTLDTAENRYVKAFLEELRDIAEELELRLKSAHRINAAGEASRWGNIISDWLAHDLWQSVGPLRALPSNSQVLQRREGYRDILAADTRLQLGVRLPWLRGLQLLGDLDGDIRPIDELYQYWCFFALRSSLRAICGDRGTQRGSLIQRTSDGIEINLQQGKKTRTDFRYSRTGRRPMLISLFYNRSFRKRESERDVWTGSYSATFRPDYSILIRSETPPPQGEKQVAHWIHFDAKYRLQALAAVASATDEESQSEPLTYKRTSLDEMHAYRDGVLGSRGAYVLYPGDDAQEEVFIRYPSAAYPSALPIPGVGAFPLRPGNDQRQRDRIEEFLRIVLDAVSAESRYVEEKGYRP